MSEPLVRVQDLCVTFGRQPQPAVRGVSFEIQPGQRLGLIGESGSGKSATALALMGLLPENAKVTGSIAINGSEVIGRKDRDLAKLRGDVMTMVFQEPMTALDPTMKVGRQVAEVLDLHRTSRDASARDRVITMLDAVGLPNPERIADSFPHQLSGGQRQRVVMAMALINRPDLVICDEPTTALDVTVQAKVLRVLDEMLDSVSAACLFISHDLAVVSQVCSEVMVMLHGEIVEAGPVVQVLTEPQHGYTRGLLATARLDLIEPGHRLPVVADFMAPEASSAERRAR